MGARETAPSKKLRFGVFEMDLGRRDLRREGLKLRLPDQAFRTLAALVESAGEVVTRERLRTLLWSDETFVDFDNNLNGIIKKLRETLRDSATAPRYIQTVPRRGYVFIASVEPIETESPPGNIQGRGRKWARATIVLMALAISAFLLLDRLTRPNTRTLPRTLLAVLPFENLSPEAIPRYFQEGLTEEIINRLAQLDAQRLGVIARTSSLQFGDTNKSIEEIREEIGVDLVIEGSIRSQGDVVRITARLIDARDEGHLWSTTFERHLSDVLDIQTGVARRVADTLKLSVLPVRTPQSSPPDQAALEAYFKGKFHWNRFTQESVAKSIEYFSESVAIEPDFALGHAALADAYNYQGFLARRFDESAFEQARLSARRAVELDPKLSNGHAALGFTLLHSDLDWKAAASELELAIVLDPGRAIVHHWIAALYSLQGKHAQALASAREARLLDPLSLFVNTDLAWYFYYAGQFEEAIVQAERVLELDPGSLAVSGCVELSLRALGRHREAIESFQKTLTKAGAPRQMLERLEEAYSSGGAPAVWKWFARSQQEAVRSKRASAYLMVVNLAAAGEHRKAVDWLLEAARRRESWVKFAAVDPALGALRSRPRFVALMRQLGLPVLKDGKEAGTTD